MRINVSLLRYASTELQNDENFILDVVREDGLALEYVDEKFSSNR